MSTNRPFVEVIAPTVAEAITRGLVDLGVTAERVETEILDEGDSLERRQARVRLTLLPEGEQVDSILTTARQTLHDLLQKLSVRGYHINATWHDAVEGEERALVLNLTGDDLSLLIGQRGEHLAALQYLLRLIVYKKLNQTSNLIIDVENYKSRRTEQLKRLAQRLAEQAIQQGRTMTLEPMPANERRIIHLALRDHPEVNTESLGTGENRKVTIQPKKKA